MSLMHIKLAAPVVAALALLALGAGAAYATALEQFNSFVHSTQAARGEFVQQQMRKDDARGKPAAPSSGTFVFARPGKFIWSYLKPYEQVLQADGDQLFIYDKDLNQVTVRKLGDALGSSPAAILFGSNDLGNNFTLKDGGTRDGLVWLRATPKAKDTTFEQISIGLRDGVPAAMELRDTFGQVSLLSFKKFERNPSLGATQFKFIMPRGADVISN